MVKSARSESSTRYHRQRRRLRRLLQLVTARACWRQATIWTLERRVRHTASSVVFLHSTRKVGVYYVSLQADWVTRSQLAPTWKTWPRRSSTKLSSTSLFTARSSYASAVLGIVILWHKRRWWMMTLSTWNLRLKWPTPFKKRRLRPISAYNVSTVKMYNYNI